MHLIKIVNQHIEMGSSLLTLPQFISRWQIKLHFLVLAHPFISYYSFNSLNYLSYFDCFFDFLYSNSVMQTNNIYNLLKNYPRINPFHFRESFLCQILCLLYQVGE